MSSEVVPAAAVSVSDESIEPLAVLPIDQQHAVMALAAGLNKKQAAESVGVSYTTMRRWTKEEEFGAALRAVSTVMFSHQMRVALSALFEVIDKEVKRGNGRTVRWFLDRTLFAEFTRSRWAARGTTVQVDLAGSAAAARQSTQSMVTERWRALSEDGHGSPPPTG